MEILEKRLLEPYLRSGSTFDSNKKTGPNFRISTSKLFFKNYGRFNLRLFKIEDHLTRRSF